MKSRSRSPTRRPSRARTSARAEATKLFPTRPYRRSPPGCSRRRPAGSRRRRAGDQASARSPSIFERVTPRPAQTSKSGLPQPGQRRNACASSGTKWMASAASASRSPASARPNSRSQARHGSGLLDPHRHHGRREPRVVSGTHLGQARTRRPPGRWPGARRRSPSPSRPGPGPHGPPSDERPGSRRRRGRTRAWAKSTREVENDVENGGVGRTSFEPMISAMRQGVSWTTLHLGRRDHQVVEPRRGPDPLPDPQADLPRHPAAPAIPLLVGEVVRASVA